MRVAGLKVYFYVLFVRLFVRPFLRPETLVTRYTEKLAAMHFGTDMNT